MMRFLVSATAPSRYDWKLHWTISQQVMEDDLHWYWVVEMATRSRSLGPGTVVFRSRPIRAEEVPCNLRPCIQDAVAEAGSELPGRRLFYLEPAWREEPTGRELVTAELIRREATRQEARFRRHASRWHWLFRLLPRIGRSLHLRLYDPVIVAELNSRTSPFDQHPESPLALIAHWD
jgi:hypothetical protein